MGDSSTVEPINIEDEIRHSYLDYAMSVIIGRALPDVRDGLKPVHRRILYAQHQLGNTASSGHIKSARVVGETMGNYHPHGDSAIYDALVRMAQGFNMRVPLEDGQGNFGSIDGDPAAAMRYTEIRMADVTSEFLADIEKDTVDWVPNYDDTDFEPEVLPTKVPNLLVNGSSGIAVGMSTNIPPHNLGETIDAAVELIENPDADVEDLMEHLPGPDFPTGGIIYGADGIREAYETGRGIIQVRARAEIEEMDESTGKSRIIVSELPFQVNKSRLIEKIADLVNEDRIDGITDLRDESDRHGMRIVIELRRDVIPEIVLNNLYKQTQLQTSFGIILLAIVHGQPEVMSLKQVLEHFLDFRRDVTTRRTIYDLEQAEDRAHILRGLRTALDHLDAVIELIRASDSPSEARLGLMSEFDLSEEQAQAILDLRLQKLTGLEREKILEELREVEERIEYLQSILDDEEKLLGVIKDELREVAEEYRDERRTDIQYDVSEIALEDLIAEEDMAVTLTHQGYIKRTPISTYRSQRRGGRGRRGMDTKEEDFVKDMFVASTHANILIFTSSGDVYMLKTHQLPEGSPSAIGQAVVNLISIDTDETVQSILPIEDFEDDKYIVMATRNGIVKRTELNEYENVHSGGIIAITLKDGDELKDVKLTSGDDQVFMTSRQGQAIRFHEQDARAIGRTAQGVIGMRLEEDDRVVGMEVIPAADREGEEDSELDVLTVTENGYGKRTNIGEYRVQSRGGKGLITMKVNDRNGPVVGARLVRDEHEVMVITDHGQVIRVPAEDISVYGRNTQGVTVMETAEDEQVVSLARLDQEEEEGEEDEEDGDTAEEAADEAADEADTSEESDEDDEPGEPGSQEEEAAGEETDEE
jgi:DNA gyrase subunit A